MSKEKKPFYKKWWVWLIAVVIIFAIIGSGENDSSENTVNQDISADQVDQVSQEQQPAENKQEEQKNEDDGRIKEGTYKVGQDIPAGEYLVFSDFSAYVENAKDSTGSLDSIIFNLNLNTGAHAYVTLKDGEYFKLLDGHMYPVDKAPSIIPDNGLYKDGMYKVGQDIPAGEYKVTLDTSSGIGYLEVSTSSRHDLDSIVTNENVQADTYITVSDGQYLTIEGLTIQK